MVIGTAEGRRLDKRFWGLVGLFVVVAVALVWRAGDALHFADEEHYWQLAMHLRRGEGYVSDQWLPTAFRPPGYPFWLAPWAFFDDAILICKLLNVALLVVAVLCMRHLVARQTPAWAWLAGAAPLLYPIWLFTATTLYPQTLCLALLMALFALMFGQAGGVSFKVALAAGVLCGALALTTPIFLPLSLWCAWCLWRSHASKALALRACVAALVGLALTVGPWTWRNWQTFGVWVPVSTNGGINLALGNCEHSGPNTGTNIPVSYFLSHVPPGANEIAESQAYQQIAVRWVSEHPADAAILYVRKWLNFFDVRSNLASEQAGMPWKDIVLGLTYYPLLLLVLVRCFWLRHVPLSPLERAMGVMYLAASLLMAVFFTRVRFRLPFDGLLMTWALISAGLCMTQFRATKASAGQAA